MIRRISERLNKYPNERARHLKRERKNKNREREKRKEKNLQLEVGRRGQFGKEER